MCTCYLCGLSKPISEFSTVNKFTAIEDTFCDDCLELESQRWIEAEDTAFDEWCLTV